jgi:hypothetical protein
LPRTVLHCMLPVALWREPDHKSVVTYISKLRRAMKSPCPFHCPVQLPTWLTNPSNTPSFWQPRRCTHNPSRQRIDASPLSKRIKKHPGIDEPPDRHR